LNHPDVDIIKDVKVELEIGANISPSPSSDVQRNLNISERKDVSGSETIVDRSSVVDVLPYSLNFSNIPLAPPSAPLTDNSSSSLKKEDNSSESEDSLNKLLMKNKTVTFKQKQEEKKIENSLADSSNIKSDLSDLLKGEKVKNQKKLKIKREYTKEESLQIEKERYVKDNNKNKKKLKINISFVDNIIDKCLYRICENSEKLQKGDRNNGKNLSSERNILYFEYSLKENQRLKEEKKREKDKEKEREKEKEEEKGRFFFLILCISNYLFRELEKKKQKDKEIREEIEKDLNFLDNTEKENMFFNTKKFSMKFFDFSFNFIGALPSTSKSTLKYFEGSIFS
jgi:hypothetical protein